MTFQPPPPRGTVRAGAVPPNGPGMPPAGSPHQGSPQQSFPPQGSPRPGYAAPPPGPARPSPAPGQYAPGFGSPPGQFGTGTGAFPPAGPPPGTPVFGPTPAFGYPPPRPPRRNGGVIAAVICGVIAFFVIAGLVVALVLNSDSSSDSTATSPRSSETTTPVTTTYPPSTTTAPGGSGDPVEIAAIHRAMQNYVDAGNTRNLNGMRAAVCSQNRAQVSLPTRPGNIVIEGVVDTNIDGDYAQSHMLIHLEQGNRRSQTQAASAQFLRENSQWLYCPGAQPSIGT